MKTQNPLVVLKFWSQAKPKTARKKQQDSKNCMCLWIELFSLLKHIVRELVTSFWWTIQYEMGHLWFNTWKVYTYSKNCKLIQTIFAFYKDRSNLHKRAIWVKPYCPAIRIYQKHFKEPEKAFYGSLSRILEATILFQCYCFPIWIYRKCLQIQRKSNRFL